MFFIPTREGIESGKVGIRDGIEFRSKISGRDAKNPGIFGTGWDRDGTGSITSLDRVWHVSKKIHIQSIQLIAHPKGWEL